MIFRARHRAARIKTAGAAFDRSTRPFVCQGDDISIRLFRYALLLPAPLLPFALAACGPHDREAGRDTTNAGEAAALGDAAAMLDANSVSTQAVGIEPENRQ